MKKLKNLIANKRGDTLIFTLCSMVFILFFTILIVDFGLAFSNRVKLQQISDAASLAGASWGKYAYVSVVDGVPHAIIKPDEAKTKASEVVQKNIDSFQDKVEITNISFNPSGEMGMNTRDQYYSGNFTVKMRGTLKTMFLDGMQLPLTDKSDTVNIPFLEFKAKARTQVTPKIK